jgi:hypothetical protein
MYIEQSELSRLRRFSLGAGLVLFTWSLAGIALPPDPRLSAFGLTLTVARPRLFPVGLAIAAAYGAIRYFYYALSFGPSPYRIRRDLLNTFLGKPHGQKLGSYRPPGMFLGRMTDISASPWTDKREEMEKLAEQLRRAFPRFAFAAVTAKVVNDPTMDDEGNVYPSFSVETTIPLRCKFGAALLDLDYTAPVWFPLLALGYWRLVS